MAERPLPQYATLATVFTGALGGFVLLAGERLPQRIDLADLGRIGLASYKLGRLVAREDVTAWVRAPVTRDEEAREPEREGMARALGELLTCPYCVGMWLSAGLTAALVVRPRETRFVATVFGAQAVADFLNAAFVRARG
ncbi:MAG TPA: DUF1360 domain-containing protein [Gaiellaceae bacterium]|nr:DUF1360 domain-containing protein [Gaiellaceae bacterium]